MECLKKTDLIFVSESKISEYGVILMAWSSNDKLSNRSRKNRMTVSFFNRKLNLRLNFHVSTSTSKMFCLGLYDCNNSIKFYQVFIFQGYLLYFACY